MGTFFCTHNSLIYRTLQRKFALLKGVFGHIKGVFGYFWGRLKGVFGHIVGKKGKFGNYFPLIYICTIKGNTNQKFLIIWTTKQTTK